LLLEAKAGRSLESWNSKIDWVLGCQWFISIILATWKAEIRKITVQGQPKQIVWEIPSPK
jgi:hypothetical protein